MNAAPLAAHDRRLARGRYEVAVHGPEVPGRAAGRRLLVAGPFRFATEADAVAYGETLDVPTGGVLAVWHYFPHPKYPDAPWTSTCVLRAVA